MGVLPEAQDLMQIDHHQASETWNRALALAVNSSPVKQFGISFGIGWCVVSLRLKGGANVLVLIGCLATCSRE